MLCNYRPSHLPTDVDGLFIGLMCGTSVDAIDVVAAQWSNGDLTVLGSCDYQLPNALRQDLLALTCAESLDFETLYRLDAHVADHHATATLSLLDKLSIDSSAVSAIGFHGQTVYHAPDESTPFTVQIGDPNRLVAATSIPVVADVRRADMAYGGQGAPLAPALHAELFTMPGISTAVLNLGGIANLTLLPGDGLDITGFDTGPANALCDAWCQTRLGLPCDKGGEIAASGSIDHELLGRLLEDPYFAKSPPKSTGREAFNLKWLENTVGKLEHADADVLATLVELTAKTVCNALERHLPDCERVSVCGGGRHNQTLMTRLSAHASCDIATTDSAGYDGDTIEALLMAWIARRRLAGKSANLPSVTGATRETPLGGLYLPPV